MQALTFFFAFVAVLALIGARRLAGSPIRRQPPRRQHQSRPDAAPGRDRCRRRRWPQAAGAGAARQHRTSADDRRSDRYRRGTQYRARDARTGSDAATARRRRGRTTAPHCAAARRRQLGRGDGPRTESFDHAEPQMPEPPPRPVRPSFADEVRRPAPAIVGTRAAIRWRASRRNPLGGRPEPRPELRGEPMPSRVTSRNEPVMPRPPRPSEAAEGRPRFARRTRRSAAASAGPGSRPGPFGSGPKSRRDGATVGGRTSPAGRRCGRTASRRAAGGARTAACPRAPRTEQSIGPAGCRARAEERL